MAISSKQLLSLLQQQQHQMLASEQQLLEALVGKLFIQQQIPEHKENKETIFDADDGAVMDILEACPVEGSNPFIPEAKCNIGKLSGSQQDNILLNAHEIMTIPDDRETDPIDEAQSPELNEALLALSNSEDKLQSEKSYGSCDISRESCGDLYSENNWSSMMNQIVLNETQDLWETKAYVEPTYPISHINLPGLSSHNDAHNFDEISHKNEKNISDESNDDKKSNEISLHADFPSYPASTNDIPNEFDENVSEETNPDDLKSNVVHHHYRVIFSEFSIQCEEHDLNKFILIETWRYEDPTLFRGGG